MYKYIIIKPDGEIRTEDHKKAPDWKTIQKYTDGIFQIVPYFSSLKYRDVKYQRGTAYVNEEGYLRGLSHNEVATAAWMRACPKGDPQRMQLCGTLLFVAKFKEPDKHLFDPSPAPTRECMICGGKKDDPQHMEDPDDKAS